LSLLNDACPWFDECEVTQRKKTETKWQTRTFQKAGSGPSGAMGKIPRASLTWVACFSALENDFVRVNTAA